MKIRLKKDPTLEGYSGRFNTYGLGEVIGSIGDNFDTWSIKDLEVFLVITNQWKDMNQAFKDNDLIVDNFNQYFREPKDDNERERGYYT